MAEQMLAYQDILKNKKANEGNYFKSTTTKSEDDLLNELLNNRKTMK